MNFVEAFLNFFRVAWERSKLHARRAQLTELLENLQLDQQTLDSMGHPDDADALVPLIAQATLELRAVESQLRAIGA